MDDLIHMTDAIEAIRNLYTDTITKSDYERNKALCEAKDAIELLEIVHPEKTYVGLANALFYLWMENLIKDSEYDKIMDRLHEAHKNRTI